MNEDFQPTDEIGDDDWENGWWPGMDADEIPPTEEPLDCVDEPYEDERELWREF